MNFSYCKLTFIDPETFNAEIAHAKEAAINDGVIEIKFSTPDGNYHLIMRQLKKYHFQGAVVWNNEERGKAVMTFFENAENTNWVLVGTWKEDNYTQDCVIELRK